MSNGCAKLRLSTTATLGKKMAGVGIGAAIKVAMARDVVALQKTRGRRNEKRRLDI